MLKSSGTCHLSNSRTLSVATRPTLMLCKSHWSKQWLTSQMKLLVAGVVAQPTTVRNTINEQFVHAHLSVRCDVEGNSTLSATNRLLKRWTSVFLNEKLAPLLDHRATE